MPAVLILHVAKVSTPATAAFGFVVQARVAPAGVVMVKVTDAVLAVTVLPPASWTVTTGWAVKLVLTAVELDGLVVKASLVAGPTMIVKVALIALVSPLEAAVSV